MELRTGAIVTIVGLVESCVHEPNERFGDIFPPDDDVILSAKYEGEWPKCLYRYLYKTGCEPTQAMVLGWTTRNIGHIWRGYMHYDYEYGKEWEPGGMDVEEQRRVWVVMPLGVANRYRKPVTVLPEQIVQGD